MSEHLGLDFEYFSGSKMEPKSELKTRGAKFVKFDSRPHGNSIFEVLGWSEIDEKLMQTGPQTKTALQEPKEAQKSCQDRAKLGSKWLLKSIPTYDANQRAQEHGAMGPEMPLGP